MAIRRRISNRPKVERNSPKIVSRGCKYVIVENNVIGSSETHVLYYDGQKIGTYMSEKDAEAARDAHYMENGPLRKSPQ